MSLSLSPSDSLGEALHYLRMSGTMYSRCDFSAPWGLVLPGFKNSLMFHVVTSGRCWLELEGEEPHLLHPGELALVPHGRGHRLASEPGIAGVALVDAPREYLSDRYEILRIDGGGETATLVCSTLQLDHPTSHHLVEMLPPLVSVNMEDAIQSEWMRNTIQLMASEARSMKPGGESIITRLADILVIQAIRSWIEQDLAAQSGWLGALRDRQIGRAIVFIHSDPAHEWTVARLASEVAMSRSAFAARFTSLVGESPMTYVSRWRMTVATHMLQDEGASVSEAAIRVGYQSEAAFSRAFKRVTGMSPGAVRRQEIPSRVSASLP